MWGDFSKAGRAELMLQYYDAEKQCILTRESRIINIGSYADIFNNMGMSKIDFKEDLL